MDQSGETPGGSRMERKKEETRKRIIQVFLRLYTQQGWDATTMEQIAREADVAKGTLYNYFPVKEEIVTAYINTALQGHNTAWKEPLSAMPDTRVRMIRVFSVLVEGIQRQSELFERYIVHRMKGLISFRRDDSIKSGFSGLAEEIIRLGQESGEIRSDLPPYVVNDLFDFAFIEAIKLFYQEPERFQPAEIIEHCVSLFLNGVKKNE